MKTIKNDVKDDLITKAVNDLISNKPGSFKTTSKFKLSFSRLKIIFAMKLDVIKTKIHLLTFSFQFYESYAYNLLLVIYSSLLPAVRAKAIHDLLTLINMTPPSKRGTLLINYYHIPVIALGRTTFSLGHYLLNALINARESFSSKDPISIAFTSSLRDVGLNEQVIDSWLHALYPYKSIHDDPHSFIPMMLIDPIKADLLMHDIKKMTEVINTESYLTGITDHIMLMPKATPDIAEVVRIVFNLLSSSYLQVPTSPLRNSAAYKQWFDEVKDAIKIGKIFKVK